MRRRRSMSSRKKTLMPEERMRERPSPPKVNKVTEGTRDRAKKINRGT